MGDTPQAAIAGTASCMAASGHLVSMQQSFALSKLSLSHGRSVPSILPCSQSTMIQSGLALARALDMLAPGNICQMP